MAGIDYLSEEHERCAATVIQYLTSTQDNSLQGDFACTMYYFVILKKTIQNLTKRYHSCSICNKQELKWLTVRKTNGSVDSLFPVCVCQESNIFVPEGIDTEKEEFSVETGAENEEDTVDDVKPEIDQEDTEQLMLDRMASALDMVNSGASMCLAARQAGIPLKQLRDYKKQIEPRRPCRKQADQDKVKKSERTEEDIEEAIRLVKEENVSSSQAAKQKGIPYTTLWYKLQDKKSGGGQRFKCSYCPMTYRRRYVRNMHERVKHKNDYPYLCTHCGKGFTYEKRMEQHIEAQHMTGDKPVKMKKCPKCDLEFPSQKDINSHLRQEHTSLPYVCFQCGEDYNTPKEYSAHRVEVHRAHFKYKCTMCDKKYNYKYLLSEHIRKAHTGERPFPCTQCPLHFPSLRLRNLHVRRYHSLNGEKYKKCPYCSKSLSSATLDKHIRAIHQGLKLYTCHHCNTKFNCLQNLNRHIRTHTGEKPFICTQCGKQFNQSNACKQHYNTHHPGVEYKSKRTDRPEKIPIALLDEGPVTIDENGTSTSSFQETDLTELLNIPETLDGGTAILN